MELVGAEMLMWSPVRNIKNQKLLSKYNGKGYAIFMHLVLNFNWYVHQGFCFFLDGYFTRNPIALLDFAKKMGINVSGTVRNDARNLPEERTAARVEVRISKFIISVTYSHL